MSKFKSMNTVERANFCAKVVAGVFAIGMIAVIGINTSKYNVTAANNEAELRDLEHEYDAIEDRSVTQEEAVVILNSAAEAGNTVAEIQNSYMESGEIDADYLSAYMMDSEDVIPWYYTANYDDIAWEFNTNYSFTMSSVPVLWTLYADVTKDLNTEKTLFAYVTATYYVESNSFGHVSLNVTAAGKEAVVKNADGEYSLDSSTDTEPESVFTDADGVGLTFSDGIWWEPDGTPRYIYDEQDDALITYTEEDYIRLYGQVNSEMEGVYEDEDTIE